MTKADRSEPPSAAAAQGVQQVHQFGRAGESLFRRLYSRLNRRGQLEGELRRQLDEAAAQSADLRDAYQQLQQRLDARSAELTALQTALGSLPDGIILQDLQGRVRLMNPTAESLLAGRAFADSALWALFERHRALTRTEAEWMPLGGAEELWLNQRIVRAQVTAIGDENQQRIGTLIRLQDATRDVLAGGLRQGFAAQIAQELKAPLNTIRLAGDLLGAQTDATAPPLLLDKLRHNVDILDRLVLELLDAAGVNAAPFEVQRAPLAVETLLWAALRGVAPQLRESGIEVLVMARGLAGSEVKGDARRLRWALEHLLRSGVITSRPGAYVAVSARVEAAERPGYAVIRVQEGGISAADVPPAPRGLGQSLFAAQAIVEIHGGSLRAQSHAAGSTFTMRLPLLG